MQSSSNILTNLVDRQAKKYGSRTAVFYREAAEVWTPSSWIRLKDRVDAVSCAFQMLGLKEFDHIGVFSANDTRILVTDFAAFNNRMIPVSLYSTSSAEQVDYIVRDAEVKLLFVGDQRQYAIARHVAAGYPGLMRIVAYHEIVLHDTDTTTLLYKDLLAMGRKATPECRAEVARRKAAAKPEDVATLLYTSGTTGDPKGAILPHSCFDAAIEFHHRRLTSLSDADTSLCFLPLSHIFEKAWSYYCLDRGIQVYVNPDPREIQAALAEVHPTCMCSVPRFWEKAYATITDKMSRMKPVNRWLCGMGLKVGRRRNIDYVRQGKKVPWWLEMRYRFFYSQIFRKVQRIMGVERGNIFPTAGAPLSPAITEFFRTIGVPVLIGYGLSETTATVSCWPYVGYQIGTIGTPLEGIDVKIGADSEILVKSPTVMRGYHNKPEATAEAFTPDGYFRTGDAGHFDEAGALVLTDRIKDLFKTSNGKYIAPQLLEGRLGEDRYIEQIAVIGNNRKYVTALVVPAAEQVKEYAAQNGIEYSSYPELLTNQAVIDLIADRIEEASKGLASYEKIKRFALLPEEFTMDSGELTNTLKLRRPVIEQRYAPIIASLYE